MGKHTLQNIKKTKTFALGGALKRDRNKQLNGRTTTVIKSGGGEMSQTVAHVDTNVVPKKSLRSILDSNGLDDFLQNAALAHREFEAKKEYEVLAEMSQMPELVTDRRDVEAMQFVNLRVPRRPQWDSNTSAEELDRMEKDSFLDWRREIAMTEASNEKLVVTPFEKNLEVWRQLWRVLERSDILVQIVDARNPLFYRSEDLEDYAKTIDPNKMNLLIINKADYLSEVQRKTWAEALNKEKVDFVFFSAKASQEQLEKEIEQNAVHKEQITSVDSSIFNFENDGRVLGRLELLAHFRAMHLLRSAEQDDAGAPPKQTIVGCVGFPNVGKSSLINVLLAAVSSTHGKGSRVGVGATPGKTKHFQTLALSEELMLCDCPGLVFPSFTSSRADMVLCGVLPINQLRDFIAPCQLVCARFPRRVLRKYYGIELNVTSEELITYQASIAGSGITAEAEASAGGAAEALLEPPLDAHTFLQEVAVDKGWMSKFRGGDESRAGRAILHQYTTGVLLYCHPPPLSMIDNDTRQSFLNDMFGGALERFKGSSELKEVDDGMGGLMIAPRDRGHGQAANGRGGRPVESAASFKGGAGVVSLDADDELDSFHDFLVGGEDAVATQPAPSRRKKKRGHKKKGYREKDPYGTQTGGVVAAPIQRHVKKPPKTGKAVGRVNAQNSGTSSVVPKGGVISAM
jgi:large subunit GTPase 1